MTDFVVKTFNTFFISFLRELKFMSSEFKDIIKKNYRTIDKSNVSYIDTFKNNITKEEIINKDFKNKYIFEHISVEKLYNSIDDTNKITLMNYLYIFSIIILFYKDYTPADEANFVKIITIVADIQNNKNVQEELDTIIDDDIKELIISLKYSTENEMNIENSTIGSLAKEIADEIDVSDLQNIEDPSDIFKCMMNFNDENNILGNIIKTVSNKVNQKLTSGELDQAQLFKEAMSMIGTGDMLNNFFNPPKQKQNNRKQKKLI